VHTPGGTQRGQAAVELATSARAQRGRRPVVDLVPSARAQRSRLVVDLVASARAQRGQAAVEFVTLLPLALVLLAGAWQAVLAAHAQWSVSAAARAAARATAVGGDAVAAAQRALPASLDEAVEVEERDDGVAVHLPVPVVLPGLDLGTLSARATFASQR
jgi:hypothetical protein